MCSALVAIPQIGAAWRRVFSAERNRSASAGGSSDAGGSTRASDASSFTCDRDIPPSPPSQVSAYLSGFRRSPSPEVREDGGAVDVVDDVWRSLHKSSEASMPRAWLLFRAISQLDRRENVSWSVQAFKCMSFSDEALFQSVLLMDRFYERQPPQFEVNAHDSQSKLLASVSLALKAGRRDDVEAPLRDLLTHLGNNQVPFDDVIRAELVMLRALKYLTGTPTALDFLDAFSARLSELVPSLANYLLHMTLFDANLHYQYPHAILAAAAMALALFAIGAPDVAYDILLEDLSVCMPMEEPALKLVPCCVELHALWVQSAARPAVFPQDDVLREKFAHERYHRVSGIPPPVLPPLLLAERPPQRPPTLRPLGERQPQAQEVRRRA
mmetsp:Transcript_42599/g.123813  ORF Transcript_42599/g.123813 Transcript_42599/m.123813 type:complete len:384 (-) Transcript_42599:148-1299(-)